MRRYSLTRLSPNCFVICCRKDLGFRSLKEVKSTGLENVSAETALIGCRRPVDLTVEIGGVGKGFRMSTLNSRTGIPLVSCEGESNWCPKSERAPWSVSASILRTIWLAICVFSRLL